MLPLRGPATSGLEWPGLGGSGLRFNGYEGLRLEATDLLGVCLPLARVTVSLIGAVRIGERPRLMTHRGAVNGQVFPRR